MLASEKGPVMGVDRFHKQISPIKGTPHHLNFNEASADEDSIFNNPLFRKTEMLPKICSSAMKTASAIKRRDRDSIYLAG